MLHPALVSYQELVLLLPLRARAIEVMVVRRQAEEQGRL